jgi:hypothetical protein
VTFVLAGLVLACAPPPPNEAEAVAWATALEPTFEQVEAALATEVDDRFPPFVCRPDREQNPAVCVSQKAEWERARLAGVLPLQAAVSAQVGESVIGVGVLIAGVGSASAGERPTPAVAGEEGPRVGSRWVGYGADRGGPFVESVRKMSVGENDIAIRIVVRPPAGP